MPFQKGDLNYSRIHGSPTKGKTGLQVAWNKGLTKETDERVLQSVLSKNGNNGHKGMKYPQKWCDNISKGNKGRVSFFGKNHPNWKGGISYEEYTPDWTEELRHKIRVRDKGMCTICKCKNKKLCVHHIDYNKKNINEKNLITLCISCHIKTNFNRKSWIEFFKEMLK